MKVAIIAPSRELLSVPHPDDFHLVLPHLLSDERYIEFYRQRSKEGDYVILDNSAYELVAAQDPEMLLKDALDVSADEIVVPDALNDGEATLELAGRAFDSWAKAKYVRLMKPQLMLVPQGKDLQEWRTCLSGLILRWHHFIRSNPELQQRDTVTLGLAVPATRRVGLATDMLLEKWLFDYHEHWGYDVHLLGVRSLYELNRLARTYPWVRSTDTVKPIVYAMQGIMLDPLHAPEPAYPGRPNDYFERTLNSHQREVARFNVAVTARLAKGQYKTEIHA